MVGPSGGGGRCGWQGRAALNDTTIAELDLIIRLLTETRDALAAQSSPRVQVPPSLTSLQGMIPADDPRSSIDPRYRFNMGRTITEAAPPYQTDPPAYGAHYAAASPQASGTFDGVKPQPPDDDLIREAMMASAMPLPPARPAGSLHMIGPLADPIGTPGAVHPDYTEADIDKTIRVPGWTATVRPPTSYTTPLKLQMMREYGYPPDTDPATLELDHKVPLCCLGHPTSPLNLYPQPREGAWGARVKDLCEVAAQHAVLNGHMSLSDVQKGFCEDWTKLHAALFSNPAVVRGLMAMEPPEDEP